MHGVRQNAYLHKLSKLKKDNVVGKEVKEDIKKDKNQEKFDALSNIISAARKACCEEGKSFDKVKHDMMEAMHIVLGMSKPEEDYEEEDKPKKERMKPKPFAHKGEPVEQKLYISGLLRPSA